MYSIKNMSFLWASAQREGSSKKREHWPFGLCASVFSAVRSCVVPLWPDLLYVWPTSRIVLIQAGHMSDMTSFLSKGWFRDCLKARFVACRAGQMTLGASRWGASVRQVGSGRVCNASSFASQSCCSSAETTRSTTSRDSLTQRGAWLGRAESS